MVFNAVSVHGGRKLSMNLFKKAMGLLDNELHSKKDDLLDKSLLIFKDRLPTLKQAGDLLVGEAINRTKGNQTIAAKLLGISQSALSQRLRKMPEHASLTD
jgi:hypothetical protein